MGGCNGCLGKSVRMWGWSGRDHVVAHAGHAFRCWGGWDRVIGEGTCRGARPDEGWRAGIFRFLFLFLVE